MLNSTHIPGFKPTNTILLHSGVWGAIDEAMLNKLQQLHNDIMKKTKTTFPMTLSWKERNIARNRNGNNRAGSGTETGGTRNSFITRSMGKEQEQGAETGTGTRTLTNFGSITLAYLSEDSNNVRSSTKIYGAGTLKNKASFHCYFITLCQSFLISSLTADNPLIWMLKIIKNVP
jgi:hypothetical protein